MELVAKLVRAFGLGCLLLTAFIPPTWADEKVTMLQGEVGDDLEFIRSRFTEHLRGSTHKFEIWKAYVARVDITKDGEPELFVLFGDTVMGGTVGTLTEIFRRVDGKWTLFAGLMVLGASSDKPREMSLFLRDEGLRYPTIYSHFSGARWSEKHQRYEGFCIRNCPQG
ncbi:MAG: hypothetical protein R3229_04785 [Alphaproteobacteria bacterium]|nr:hypothetical protein [Alphaproteobacteria bacterium]